MTARTDHVDYRTLSASRVGPDAFPAESPVTLLHRYWQSTAPAPGSLPGRQHIDPREIGAKAMPWVFLLDVVRGDPLDYAFRLVGTGNVSLVGRDATGQLASEVFDRVGAPFVLETFDSTVAEAAPTVWIVTVPHDRSGEVTIHRGPFPLARDGRTVDMLLCVAAPWPAA